MKNLITILTAFLYVSAFGQQHYPLKNMWGTVTLPWDIDTTSPAKPNAIINAGFTIVRNYSDVPINKDSFDLTEGYALTRDRRGFYPDAAFKNLRNHGIITIQTWQNQSKGIRATWTAAGKSSTVPYEYNADLLSGPSYQDIANDCYILASHGGTNPNVPDYTLFQSQYWWEAPQIMYKGAGFYSMIEPANEPDMLYTDGHMTGQQMAVMWNECYSKTKAADPNMMMCSSGVATDSASIAMDAVHYSLDHFGRLPFDIYQFHTYPWGWPLGMAGGLPPEYFMVPNAKRIADSLHRYGKNVMIGECGWDIHQRSWLRAPAHDGYTAEQVRGQLTIRAMLGFDEAGIKYVTWYKALQDYGTINDSNETIFATMNLLYDQCDSGKVIKRRTVADYGLQLVNKFGYYSFSSTMRNDSVMVKVFKNGKDSVLVAWTVEKVTGAFEGDQTWRPQFTEQRVNQFFPSGTIYRLNDDSSGRLMQDHHDAGTVELTSSPLFFVPDPVTILPVTLISFTAQKINKAVVLKWVVEGTDNIEVERSTDGVHFSALGTGIFNKYVDMHPAYGRNYYRLKMVDTDGSVSYSKILVIAIKGVHQPVTLYNSLGEKINQGFNEDVDKWKQQLRPGIYFFRYDTYTEPFIRQ